MSDSGEYDFHALDDSDEAMEEFYTMFPSANRDSETLFHRTPNEDFLPGLSNFHGQASFQSLNKPCSSPNPFTLSQELLPSFHSEDDLTSEIFDAPEQSANQSRIQSSLPAIELKSSPPSQINIQEKGYKKDKQVLFVVRSNPVLTQQQSASNEVQGFIEPKLVSRFAQNEQSQLVESLNYAGVIQAKHRMIIGRMSDLLEGNAQFGPTDSLKLQELRIQREAALKEASESLRSTLLDSEPSSVKEHVASGSVGSSRNLGQSRSDVITPNVDLASPTNPPEIDVDMLKARGFYPPILDPSPENGIVRFAARETDYKQRSKINQAQTSEPPYNQSFEAKSGNCAKRTNCSKRKISKVKQKRQQPSRLCKFARCDINDTGNARNDDLDTSESAINQEDPQTEQAEQTPVEIEQKSLEQLQLFTRMAGSCAHDQEQSWQREKSNSFELPAVYSSLINDLAEQSIPFAQRFEKIWNRNRPRGASKARSEFGRNIANDQKQSLPNKSSQLNRNLGKDASQDEQSDASDFESIFTQDICDSADRRFEVIREFLQKQENKIVSKQVERKIEHQTGLSKTENLTGREEQSKLYELKDDLPRHSSFTEDKIDSEAAGNVDEAKKLVKTDVIASEPSSSESEDGAWKF